MSELPDPSKQRLVAAPQLVSITGQPPPMKPVMSTTHARSGT